MMKSFSVKDYDRSVGIVFGTTKDLEDAYALIIGEENFVVNFTKDGVKCSEIIIAQVLSYKLNSGKIVFRSEA